MGLCILLAWVFLECDGFVLARCFDQIPIMVTYSSWVRVRVRQLNIGLATFGLVHIHEAICMATLGKIKL